jgi:rSAM/selenodomain-associated transferase 1
MQRNLLIFAKAPRLGLAKRRLARDIGSEAAWKFYRCTTRRLILNLAADPRWRCHLVVTPDSFDGRERFWPLSCPVIKQGTGDLGVRMGRAFNAMPPGATVLVGSDIPELTPRHIAQAFTALGRNQAVFGPAEDGGYWLVGLSARARRASPFQNVAWSSPKALADTTRNLAGRSIAVLETLSDIDVGADHTRWRTRCRDRG